MRKHFLTLFAVLLAASTFAPGASSQGALAGKFLDEETEAPIVGALIVFENPSANPARIEQTTDEEGGFTVLGMVSGMWSIRPSAKGYEPRAGTIDVRQVRNPAVEIFLKRLKNPPTRLWNSSVACTNELTITSSNPWMDQPTRTLAPSTT